MVGQQEEVVFIWDAKKNVCHCSKLLMSSPKTMLFLTLLSLPQRPLRVLRRLGREIKERTRRTIGGAYGRTTHILFFYSVGKRAKYCY